MAIYDLDEEEREQQDFTEIEPTKEKSKKLIDYITKEEYEQLFQYTRKYKKKNRKQYALALMLGFEAGMRISEYLGLNGRFEPLQPKQVSLQENFIRVTGKGRKGGKERVVPLPRRFNVTALKLLPLTIDRRSFQRYVKMIGKKVLGKRITPHTLRHGFVTHLINVAGRPEREVQMLAGHSRRDTTMLYTHSSPRKAVDGARDAF